MHALKKKSPGEKNISHRGYERILRSIYSILKVIFALKYFLNIPKILCDSIHLKIVLKTLKYCLFRESKNINTYCSKLHFRNRIHLKIFPNYQNIVFDKSEDRSIYCKKGNGIFYYQVTMSNKSYVPFQTILFSETFSRYTI